MNAHANQLRERLLHLDGAALCDASPLVRALAPGLKPVCPSRLLVGRAHTIKCSNDYLTVIRGLQEAAEGDVLVVDGGRQSQAIFGELLAAEAKRRGLAGAVIDGAVHHVRGMAELDFPVYYRWTNPRAGRADVIEPPIDIISVCGVAVAQGDWIYGDADGVVILPLGQAEEIVAVAEEIKKVDAKVFDSVKGGASLTEIMKFEEFRREHEREIRTRIDYHLSEK